MLPSGGDPGRAFGVHQAVRFIGEGMPFGAAGRSDDDLLVTALGQHQRSRGRCQGQQQLAHLRLQRTVIDGFELVLDPCVGVCHRVCFAAAGFAGLGFLVFGQCGVHRGIGWITVGSVQYPAAAQPRTPWRRIRCPGRQCHDTERPQKCDPCQLPHGPNVAQQPVALQSGPPFRDSRNFMRAGQCPEGPRRGQGHPAERLRVGNVTFTRAGKHAPDAGADQNGVGRNATVDGAAAPPAAARSASAAAGETHDAPQTR